MSELKNAINELGTSFSEFKEDQNGRIDELEKRLNRPRYKDSSTKSFSLKNAILSLSDPEEAKNVDAGYEREVSQELKNATGIKTERGEMLVPISAFTKTLTAGGTGNNIIADEVQAEMFVDVLRNNSIIMDVARTLMNLKGDVSIPKKTGSTTAYWFSGDGSDDITSSDVTLDGLPLTPHFVAGLTKYSYKVLTQSDPGVERLLEDDLIQTIGVEIDRAAINGSGSGNEPKGILQFADIGSVEFDGTSGPTWAEVVEMEQELADNNALRGNLNYLNNSGLLTHLKTTEKASGTAEFLHADGRMNDYPSHFTANVPEGQQLFGNFDDLIVAMWGAIKLRVDPYSEFSSGTTAVRAILPIDFTVRHEESFAVGEVDEET